MATPQTIRGMNTQVHKSSLSLDASRRIFPTLTSSPLIGHKDKVHSVAWNCTGSKLGSGSVDKTVRIWSFDNSGVKGDLVLKGHEKSVDQLCWDPLQENRLATASGDKTVRIWDARTAQSQVVQTTGENIFIAWSPDSQYIAVGNKEDVLTIIDTRTFKTLNSTKFAFEVNEIKWDPSNKFLYLTTGSGQLEVMHFPAMKRVSNLYSHTSNCYCIEFDPSGRYYAIGSADALVSLWDADEMICIRTFGRLDNPVRTLSFSFDSQFIASASEDFVVDISHVETGELAYSLQCSSAMNSVAWHPSAYLLAYAGDEQAKNNQQGGAGLVSVFGYSPP